MHADDRRVFERFMARFPTKFKNSRNGYGTSVFLRDVSADGVRIASKERPFLKDSVELMVELPDAHAPMLLKGQVVWLKGTKPRVWDAGVKFDQVDFMKTQRLFKFCQ